MSDGSPADGHDEVPEQIRVRQDKRRRLLAEGVEVYPADVERTHTLAQVRAAYDDRGLEPDTRTGDTVSVTGRVIHLRNTGKLCFVRLREGDGTELQAMLSLAELGEEALERYKHLVDIGDFSYADAAQILDVPIGTVMSRLHRGRRALKQHLAEGVS